jgi:hypothetical protein
MQEIAEVLERRSTRLAAAVQRDQERKERQETAQALKRRQYKTEFDEKKRQNESIEETTDCRKKDAKQHANRRKKESSKEKADRLDKQACYQCKYVGKK